MLYSPHYFQHSISQVNLKKVFFQFAYKGKIIYFTEKHIEITYQKLIINAILNMLLTTPSCS